MEKANERIVVIRVRIILWMISTAVIQRITNAREKAIVITAVVEVAVAAENDQPNKARNVRIHTEIEGKNDVAVQRVINIITHMIRSGLNWTIMIHKWQSNIYIGSSPAFAYD
jgi:hypothetical protein